MKVMQKAHNAVRGLVQRYGSTKLRQWLWDYEYSRDQWECLDAVSADPVYSQIERYAAAGSILDLGCGAGSTATQLDPAAYRFYTGVDISEVALAQAVERTARSSPTVFHEFTRSDLTTYKPARQYDVILFRDSIYYLPAQRVPATLHRYARFLKSAGVLIVRMYDITGKHKAIAACIEGQFEIVQKEVYNHSQTAVFVFRATAGLAGADKGARA